MKTTWRDRRRTLTTFALKNTTEVLEIQLYYNEGGMNYFAGYSEARGLYLSVTPVAVDRDAAGKIVGRSTMAFSGTKLCVKETKRFNLKEFNSFTYKSEDLQKLVDHVLAKNHLELA